MDDKTDDTKPVKKAASRSAKSTKVNAREVRRGVTNSDSVRHVQRVLAGMDDLPKELRPEATGDYDSLTTRAVRWWQNNNGYVGGRGVNPNLEQVAKLLGDDYTVVDE